MVAPTAAAGRNQRLPGAFSVSLPCRLQEASAEYWNAAGSRRSALPFCCWRLPRPCSAFVLVSRQAPRWLPAAARQTPQSHSSIAQVSAGALPCPSRLSPQISSKAVAAYGVTVLIWQHGWGTKLLFDRARSGSVTIGIPIAVFAFLFGLSMDYEVFLLSRIREEHDNGASTDMATVNGVARTGRLVTSAALILFLAFVSLSRVPTTDVKILATALALGIIIDATIVRGVLAPALVAALGPANWWHPGRGRRAKRPPVTPLAR